MSVEALKSQLEALFFAETEKFWLNLYQHKYSALIDELCAWELIYNRPENEDETDWLVLQSIAFLRHKIETLHEQILLLEVSHTGFVQRIAKSEFASEKELHIIAYAQELGTTKAALEQDKKAFSRWFDEGAVVARYQHQVAAIEQQVKFLIAKLGALTNRYLRAHHDTLENAWQRLDLQPFCLNLLAHSQNQHIRHGLIRALVNMVATLNNYEVDSELDAELIAKLIELLESDNMPYQAIVDILEILIHQRPTFIRAYMWALLEEANDIENSQQVDAEVLYILSIFPKIIVSQPKLTEKDLNMLCALSEHTLPRVRQVTLEFVEFYPTPFAQELIAKRFEQENENAVLFTLIKQLSADRFCQHDFAFLLWQRVLTGDFSMQLKRLALEQSARIMLNMQLESNQADLCFKRFIDTLNKCLSNETNIAVCRYITRAREQLGSFYHQVIIAQLNASLEANEQSDALATWSRDELGRSLSYIAQRGQSLNASKTKAGWRIQQGYRQARRLWRVIHEIRQPSTDKRQSYSHTKAKKPSVSIHVPSCTTAEISETKVPGELLFNIAEQTSRPHLPLLDFLLSVLTNDHRKEDAKTYTPDGILAVTPPSTLWRRLKAYWTITWQFAELDRLRKGNELEQGKYLDALNTLGFSLRFSAYGDIAKTPFPVAKDIQQLYTRSGATSALLTIWSSFKEYVDAIYQNSISQLVFFVLVFISYFWTRHIYVSKRIKQNRKHIPVSIGGWGTRGKSGTERLKSALFSSLALRVVSKTTGCEAMLIYSKISGEQYEIPLFRPFDKASIWEQADVLHFAKQVKADVFLWECMGLTPRYVKILVRWMKDNFATITNAYPDHEDILGPTGLDVAKEMSAFLGYNTQVFTAEQNMASVLNLAAEQKNTSLIQIHWGDGYQITPDILAKYPYVEHPDNIALVCKMAQYIGINKDYVFKETASRVIPDVGVLQQFTTAKIGAISQSFINSMSANERLATIENWKRLNIVEQGKQGQIVALINNRNDRVARSQVFANILANDLHFDAIVVIGTNIDGFFKYFMVALENLLHSIFSNNDHNALCDLLTRFRLTLSRDALIASLNTTADKLPESAFSSLDSLQSHLNSEDETHQLILKRFEAWTIAYTILEVEDLNTKLSQTAALAEQLATLKCTLVHDSDIKPDALNQIIAKQALPNEHQIIVGMQNIKGAGLGYVYMWQKWQLFNQHCERLSRRSVTQTEFRNGLSRILQQEELSAIECQYLADKLDLFKMLPNAQSEFSQAELTQIKRKLEQQTQRLESKDNTRARSPLTRFLNKLVESFLDAGAAVKRKKIAVQVYKDIADFRITIEKATLILSELNRSQKPGWLKLQSGKRRKK
ncbi:poly-gamma-glutamate synthase PgsB [Pseudoalteromonas piscicida]|uniref:poly-gamma-glutamate synthase PgsB n=1 Tax=Pseudoalteromonas piscicida TaxID=43662 RepID=UPI001EFD0E16|nr:poly-gamma-glutamate synthase PgsB [Pseudoalteromonas piscicida]MCG9769592.1 poly-gamma-glutamate synthase PgsB [Pseudoalteromonas piscicida]